jgi:hypothetical protein
LFWVLLPLLKVQLLMHAYELPLQLFFSLVALCKHQLQLGKLLLCWWRGLE